MEQEILALLNQILAKLSNQYSKQDILVVVIPSLLTLTGTLSGVYLVYLLGFKNQKKIADRTARQNSYSDLMGLKFSISQLYVSRFEARIYSDFHEMRCKLLGASEGSHDFTETKRWMQKSEDLVLDIANKNERIFHTIGVIKSVFQASDELDKLTNKIYKFKPPSVHDVPSDIKKIEQLNDWKVEAISLLQAYIQREITEPLDQLLNYIEGKLKNT